jgi:STE24 endopeptidase
MPDGGMPPETPIDNDRQAKARRYASIRRRLSVLELVFSAALMSVLVFTGLSRYLSGFLDLPVVLSALCYFLLLMMVYSLITAPLSYYAGLVLPRRYGLSRQNFKDWLADSLKSGVLSLALGIIIVAAVYWLMSVSSLWWLWAWVITMIISVLLSGLAPLVILPLFYKTRPLDDGELRDRLLELAAKAGLDINGIYAVEFSAKTSTANAALMGVGRPRRILLSDTLLDSYTTEEILTVMGHEMGHQRHRDTLRLFVFQGLILLLTFYLAAALMGALAPELGYGGITDTAALPLLIMIIAVLGFITAPLLAAFTRYIERQADLYTLRLTDMPDAFISAMSRLTDQNLAEAEPPRWVEVLMDDHPSYRQRLDMAQRFKNTQS